MFLRSRFQILFLVHHMSPDGRTLLDDGIMVFDGHENHPTIEGPKFYKRNGYYYIFAPGGGVQYGWQTVLRSRDICGPYEDRVVLHEGKTGINGPHQGAWVELENGESWFYHFQDRMAYGRIVHMQPMKWIEDWPVIGSDPDGENFTRTGDAFEAKEGKWIGAKVGLFAVGNKKTNDTGWADVDWFRITK